MMSRTQICFRMSVHTYMSCLIVSLAYFQTLSVGERFGAHRKPEGDINEVDGFLNPEEFFKQYVKPQKPVIFRGAAHNLSAFQLWSDQYLNDHYGFIPVEVEVGKKEDRGGAHDVMTMSQFVRNYQHSDVYMVQNVPTEMFDTLELFHPLSCGGFQRILQSMIMWLSSGGTTSVLHNDEFENINCVLDGSKQFIFIDESEEDSVEADGFVTERGYSLVDVDDVDFEKFPELRDVPWWNAQVNKGDCVYIPVYWYHIVISEASRSLAVNCWFAQLHWFDSDSCTQEASVSLQNSMFDENNAALEKLRSEIFEPFGDVDFLTVEDAVRVWHPWQKASPSEIQQVFDIFDLDKDLLLSWSEIYSIDMEQLLYEFQFILPPHYLINPDTQEDANSEDMYLPGSETLEFDPHQGGPEFEREPESFVDEDSFRDEL